MNRATFAASLVLTLAGCAATAPQRAADTFGSIEGSATTALNRSQVVQPVRGPVIQDVPFVDVRPVPAKPSLPPVFQRNVTFNEPAGVPLQVLAQRIEASSGLRVAYQAELIAESGDAAPPADALSSLLAALPPIGGDVSFGASSIQLRSGVALNYTGPLSGLLDAVAASTNSYWRFEQSLNRVTFYRFVTETFRISAAVGQSESAASIGSGSGGGGQRITSGQASASHQTNGSVWNDIEASLARLMSPEGVYAMSQNLGTIVIRDRPDRMELIRAVVENHNTALATQISFEVNVYRVQVRDADTKGLNWSLFFQRFMESSPYQIAFLGNNPTLTDPLSQGVIRVNPEASGRPQRWGASNVVVEALSTLGNTSVLTSVTAVTTNNNPTPVRVTRKRAYVQEVSQAISGTGGSAIATGAQITAGEIETGLVMYLLPHVQDDGKRVLLKAMASLSALERLENFTIGDQTIQLPQVVSREFQQTAWLNSGETLVLAGFEQTEGDTEMSSPFDWRAWPMSGRRSARNEREVVVVTITPNVMAARSRI